MDKHPHERDVRRHSMAVSRGNEVLRHGLNGLNMA